jgi:hypothetical protein
MLCTQTSHPAQPDADKRAQAPLVSQHEPEKWRPGAMVWNGSAPYGSTQRCDGSGTEVMNASTPTTSAAQQPPTRICNAWRNQQVLRAPQHLARVTGRHTSIGKTELPLRNTKMQSSKKQRGKRDVGPTAGSLPLPRWARVPLSVPCRSGTPAYKFQDKTKGETCKSQAPACD